MSTRHIIYLSVSILAFVIVWGLDWHERYQYEKAKAARRLKDIANMRRLVADLKKEFDRAGYPTSHREVCEKLGIDFKIFNEK